MAKTRTRRDVDFERDAAALREQLNACRGQWPLIALSGEVSHSWLSQFARGLIPNPGVATLQRVHAALSEFTGRRK